MDKTQYDDFIPTLCPFARHCNMQKIPAFKTILDRVQGIKLANNSRFEENEEILKTVTIMFLCLTMHDRMCWDRMLPAL